MQRKTDLHIGEIICRKIKREGDQRLGSLNKSATIEAIFQKRLKASIFARIYL